MRLKNISLKNYRCFKEAEIDFDEHITLIVGKNKAGKTAILDAIAVSASTFLLRIDGGVSKSILKDDATYKSHNLNGTMDRQHQFPVSIHSLGNCMNEQNIKWTRSLNSTFGKTTIKDARKLTNISKQVQNQIMIGDKSLVLPLISYYGARRLCEQKKNKRIVKPLAEFNRQVGYVDCMAAEFNEKLMMDWFQTQTLKSFQNQQKTGTLDKPVLLKTVEQAICKSYEKLSGSKNANIFFDFDTHRLVLDFQTGDGKSQRFAMDEMSDEYKNVLGIISDIAYRMAILNPMLGDHVLEKTPGIVLIDEVDLYLHSQWQQTILNDLRTIFPNIQFIVSLHGLAMINSVTIEQIRILDKEKIQKKTQEKFYIELYHSGNKDLKAKAIWYFIYKYENLIKQQIQQLCPGYVSAYFNDLLCSGKIGILVALQKYNSDKGTFMTFSKPYIRHEVTRFLREIVAQN